MGEVLILKLISVLEIAVASVAGACLPFLYIRYGGAGEAKDGTNDLDSQPIFFMLKALSCGIIIGVALLHLLPDADELLSEQWDYPVCFAAAALGLVLCLVCEQFAMWVVSTAEETQGEGNNLGDIEGSGDVKTPLMDDNGGFLRNRRHPSTGSLAAGRTISVSGRPVRFESNSYVLEGAIAVHSVVMGISLGALGNDELSEIRVLMIAYGVHQLLEGISLGCAISAAEMSAGRVVGLITFFSATLPAGILIGLSIASTTESQAGEIIAGLANGIAAGILIYVSMVEMMADEFSNKRVVDDYQLKTQMIFAVVCGISIMALLAVWA
ncbi:unnamed protein product [Ectocarpus fasciculatus]